jgi:hypothetical protein
VRPQMAPPVLFTSFMETEKRRKLPIQRQRALTAGKYPGAGAGSYLAEAQFVVGFGDPGALVFLRLEAASLEQGKGVLVPT